MTPLLTVVGWTLIHFVWQAVAIALPLAAMLRMLARRSANVRYLVACAGLAAMLASPIATARVLLQSADVVTAPAVSAPIAANGARNDVTAADHAQLRSAANIPAMVATAIDWRRIADLDRIAPAISVAWLAGVTLLLLRMFSA